MNRVNLRDCRGIILLGEVGRGVWLQGSIGCKPVALVSVPPPSNQQLLALNWRRRLLRWHGGFFSKAGSVRASASITGCMRAIDLSQRIWGSPSGISYARPARSEMLVQHQSISAAAAAVLFISQLTCVWANPASKRSPRCELTLVQLQMWASSQRHERDDWYVTSFDLWTSPLQKAVIATWLLLLVCATPKTRRSRIHTNNSTGISV